MKTDGIRNLLILGTIGLMFLMNSSFVGSETPMIRTSTDEMIAPETLHTVVIKGMMFTPSELHVKKGDTVEWINQDIVAHNVTDFPGKKWASGTLAKGKSWKKVVNSNLDYYCSIHPTMKGKVIVDH